MIIIANRTIWQSMLNYSSSQLDKNNKDYSIIKYKISNIKYNIILHLIKVTASSMKLDFYLKTKVKKHIFLELLRLGKMAILKIPTLKSNATNLKGWTRWESSYLLPSLAVVELPWIFKKYPLSQRKIP